MTTEEAWAEAYLVQARSDFRAFEILKDDERFPFCHALHYLQMATEKLGKAIGLRSGWRVAKDNLKRHDTFVRALRLLWRGPLPYHHRIEREAFRKRIDGMLPLANEVQGLAPDLAGDGPNAEYPWAAQSQKVLAPVNFDFPVWGILRGPKGLQMLGLVNDLLRDFEKVFG